MMPLTPESSYNSFLARDTYTRLGPYWTDRKDLLLLKQPNPEIDLRNRIMKQLTDLPFFFTVTIKEKYFYYERSKHIIKHEFPIDKLLHDVAMDKMASLFARKYMNPLLATAKHIAAILPNVATHLEQFREILLPSHKFSVEKASELLENIHATKKNLHQNLVNLQMQMQLLCKKVNDLILQGCQIGPAFTIEARELTSVVHKKTRSTTDIDCQITSEFIDYIENIKQEQSTAQGTQHFYLFGFNVFQSLYNLERGMAGYLKTQFAVAQTDPKAGSSLRRNSLSSSLGTNELKTSSSPSSSDQGEIHSCVVKLPMKTSRQSSDEETTPTTSSSDSPSGCRLTTQTLDNLTDLLSCPITQKLFKNPVTIETGYTFERNELLDFFTKHSSCPVTGAPLLSKEIIPNLTIKCIAQRFATAPYQKKFFLDIPECRSLLTGLPFVNPVIVSSGMSYEKEEVELLLLEKTPQCPIIRIPLNRKIQYSNIALRDLMLAAPQNGFKRTKQPAQTDDHPLRAQADERPRRNSLTQLVKNIFG